MYGLVNRALQDMISEEIGAQGWSRVCERANIEEPIFISMETYDDALTYTLVGAACEELQRGAAQLLQQLGHFWVKMTAKNAYRPIFNQHGSSLRTFLENLDHMHARLSLSFPKMQAPTFGVESSRADASITVRYWSTREGLSPFVLGLLEGLCDFFAEPHDVQLTAVRDAEHDHAVFHLTPTA